MTKQHRLWLILLLLWVTLIPTIAQTVMVKGIVKDGRSGMPIPYVNIRYEGTNVGTVSDAQGNYSIAKHPGKTLAFTCIGYAKKTENVSQNTKILDIKLVEVERQLGPARIKVKKQKYSRKDNPAVELMKKVIAAKKENNLHKNDYFSYDKYQKLTFAVNEFTEKVYQEGKFKNMPFLKNHVEKCEETGKLILPISVQESYSQHIYRKSPESEKDIIKGKREEGINQLFNTGDILNTVIADCFTDVDIYEENVRLLQHPFISPISTHNAIGFYRYFIVDTVMVAQDKCIEVTFTPNNPQDFGFMGSLYIMNDSTYRVRRVSLEIPSRSDVNFVEQLNVNQEFLTLPSGEQVISSDKMTVQLALTEFLTKFQVQRGTFYSNYNLSEIPQQQFKFSGKQIIDPNAAMHDETFWANLRPEKLTKTEGDMKGFVKDIKDTKHFKFFLFILKAFVENFVETTTDPEHPSKIDIGPVNTMITHNFIDGLRLRMSGQTTANLNKHLFAKGYVAYGFLDKRWKGLGELTYSFNEKAYTPQEYPMNNLTVSYQTDVMAPSDKFLPTDKDNVFTALKFTKVDQMMYFNKFKLKYQKEWGFGLRLDGEFIRERDEACGKLFYQKLDGIGNPSPHSGDWQRYLNTSSITLGVNFQPHATYVNTKQRRITVNRDAPVMSLHHTMGFKDVLGNDYTFNFTEATFFKRIWIPSAGKIDLSIKGGVQWNKVPYPLLIMPAADLSYIVQKETFSMVNNMEFLNDRYASLMLSWDLNGKILNRIPLMQKLKWREYFGFNALWGSLSDKNNPFLNPNDHDLMYFPGHFNNGTYEYSSYVMGDKPYCEAIVGLHNIFKVLHVQAVRRLTYLDNPLAKKWGFRLKLVMTF